MYFYLLILIVFLLLWSLFFENFKNIKGKIPKIIIQTWKSEDIPDKYIKDILSLKKYNPDFEFKFFTDKDIVNFLSKNYPEYYTIYKKLPLKIQKIDYFRYVAIYHFGGFYFDLDILGLQPLNDLCDKSCIFPIDMHIKEDMCDQERYMFYCKNNTKYLLGQYAFAAQPKHPFIKKIIEAINQNINKFIADFDTEFGKTHEFVYKSTGPDLVTDVYLNYNDNDDITILYHREGQYFGNYAKHNFYGSWK
jgi:mannosyltransferase OCH1-like enzyme